MSKKKKSRRPNFLKKYTPNQLVKYMWLTFAGMWLFVFVLFTCIATGLIGYMPPIADLENPIDKYASQIYASDGELLGTFSQEKNNRIYSTYNDLPPYIIEALIATEDARFYEHSGIDAFALGRAIVKTGILQQSSGGGGSTITQQLAKQLYTPIASNFLVRLLQKPIEWVIAVKLERYYTKAEIINLYLNQYDFSYNAVGIQSASQVYFNKTPKELTIEEAATLVGMCKNSALYNPVRRNERTKGRRNVVLEQMEKYSYISKQQLDSLSKLDLVLNFKRVDHKDGLAPYFREYLRITMNAHQPDKSNYASWQTEQYKKDSLNWEKNPLYGWCIKNRKSDGSAYNLTTDGLKIYTTIDSRMQLYAEQAVEEHFSKELQPDFDREKKGRAYAPYSVSVAKKADSLLYKAMKVTGRYRGLKRAGMSDKEIYKEFKKPVDMKVFSWKGEIDTTMTPLDSIRYHKSFLRTGFTAMDTHTGYVKAYVGGIDYRYFQYDMVTMGRRQVGSTIKPYLYTLAMQEGMTPCDEMLHEEQVLITESGKEWRPGNASPARIGEQVTIKWGLQNSDNWVTAYLMKQTSPYVFTRFLRSFGITGKIDAVESMALGTPDVSVAEMASAYTTFANKGIRATPIYVTRVEDSFGNVVGKSVADFAPKLEEVFGITTYVKMLDMLRAVVDGGTGSRVRHYTSAPMGGKTGTTQNNSDGWYMGFTPRLSVGCWVGGEERAIHFDRTRDGQGAAMALPIFGLFMKKVYADPALGYRQSEQFEAAGGDPCAKPEEEAESEAPIAIDKQFN